MNRTQKIARFNLIVISIALTLSLMAIGVFYFIFGLPIRGAFSSFGFLGICGLIGLTPFLFKKEGGNISFDERDLLIHRNATLIAYSVFWVFFTAGCMIPWWILKTGASIPVAVLPAMLAAGFIIVQIVQSVAVLVQYGWAVRGEKHE
jgi:hypothetical protein